MTAKKVAPKKPDTKPAAEPEKDWFINGSLLFSIDKTDKRSVEKVQEDIKKALEKVVKNVTFTGTHVVVNGKSYHSRDFDQKTGTIREGALYIGENPTARNPANLKTVAETLAAQRAKTPREALAEVRRERPAPQSDPEVEFDWDESDFGTDEVAAVAEKAVDDAVKKLTATPKKTAPKKVAPPAKKSAAKKTQPRRGGRK